MANSDKLWFELGVRDEVSKTLGDIMNQAEALKDMMDSITLGKDAVRNAQDIEQALDRIAVARNRISEAKSVAGNRDDIDMLKKMDREIAKIQKKFEALGKLGDNVTQAMMGTRGFASYMKMLNNLPLALDQIRRKTGEVTAQAEADERAKAAEASRIDTLKEKYNELYRVRKQLQDAVMSAAPGVDTTNAVSMINSLSSRMGTTQFPILHIVFL